MPAFDCSRRLKIPVMFFTGLHQPSDGKHIERAFVSVNRTRQRRSSFAVGEWIMDSGAFTTIHKHGGYPDSVEHYAEEIRRWKGIDGPQLLSAVSQDFMCEPMMIERTGLSIAEHQRLTIERYDALLRCDLGGCYLMPVLQGYEPRDYVEHLRQYGSRLAQGAWVGVGSVCKRNGDPQAIEAVLLAIHNERPDLLLHGFGVKKTALSSPLVCTLLHSADSMAWSYAARKQGRDANDWREAAAYSARIGDGHPQRILFKR